MFRRKNAELTNTINCPRECHQIHYKTSWTSFESPNELNDGMMMIFLNITNLYLETTTITEMPKMTIVELLSNIGGLLGLWIGASFLTILEVVEWIANVVYSLFKQISSPSIRRQAVVPFENIA